MTPRLIPAALLLVLTTAGCGVDVVDQAKERERYLGEQSDYCEQARNTIAELTARPEALEGSETLRDNLAQVRASVATLCE